MSASAFKQSEEENQQVAALEETRILKHIARKENANKTPEQIEKERKEQEEKERKEKEQFEKSEQARLKLEEKRRKWEEEQKKKTETATQNFQEKKAAAATLSGFLKKQ